MNFTADAIRNGNFGKAVYKIAEELGIPRATFLHSKMVRGWVDVTHPGIKAEKSSWRYGTEVSLYSSRNYEWMEDLSQKLTKEGFIAKVSSGSMNVMPDFRRLDTRLVEEVYQEACETLERLSEQRYQYPAMYTREWRLMPYVSKQTVRHLNSEMQDLIRLKDAIEDSRKV